MPGKVFTEKLPEQTRPKLKARLVSLAVLAAPFVAAYVQVGPGKVGY